MSVHRLSRSWPHCRNGGGAYRKDGNKLVFHTKKAPAALEILSAHKAAITDFEVKKGALNEVFLAITGKEIRES